MNQWEVYVNDVKELTEDAEIELTIRTLNAGTGSPAALNIDYTTGGGSSAQPPRTLHQFRQRRM